MEKSSWAAAVKSTGYPGPKLPLAQVPALPGPAERGHLAPAETWGCKFPEVGRDPPLRGAELSLSQHPGLSQPHPTRGAVLSQPGAGGLLHEAQVWEFPSHGEGAAPASLLCVICHQHLRSSAARTRSPPRVSLCILIWVVGKLGYGPLPCPSP